MAYDDDMSMYEGEGEGDDDDDDTVCQEDRYVLQATTHTSTECALIVEPCFEGLMT
jgi:hypothetical protein